MRKWLFAALVALLLLGGWLAAGWIEQKRQASSEPGLPETREWIIKWREHAPSAPGEFVVLQRDDRYRLMVVRLHEHIDVVKWVDAWSKRTDVEYVQPNRKLRIKALPIPNDKLYTEQTSYLHQIRATQAWRVVREAPQVTVAIVDTGVDLVHPDLKPNLVPGVNLVEPDKLPQDDNGHGTALAGIVAAVGNNDIGVSGVLWRVRVMPVKVLDARGEGDDYTVGMGIREAVDRGADVVLLSLGDPIYSQHMKESIAYAEQRGVVVVAATGNRGTRVEYPAAFPTVLAVGAVDSSDRWLHYSNYGPEVDVVAPGTRVYTTALGGGYDYARDGTSMAAPQVAAVAAMLKALHPQWTPRQIRNQIRLTADDVGLPGWDEKTGFGRLNAYRAVTAVLPADPFEPNNRLPEAHPLPVFGERVGSLPPGDADWWRVDMPYAGELLLTVEGPQASAPVRVEAYPNGKAAGRTAQTLRLAQTVVFNLPKGSSWIKLSAVVSRGGPIGYALTTKFRIYSDPYEPNDSLQQAKPLSWLGQTATLTGTIHRDGDEDWFQTEITRPGRLDVRVTVDTLRFDPVVGVENPAQAYRREIDEGNVQNGQAEVFSLEVKPGVYYLRVTNYYGVSVDGEYTLQVHYTPELPDPAEPNEVSWEAHPLTFGVPVSGTLDSVADFDWYAFSVPERGVVTVRFVEVPPLAGLRLTWYDGEMRLLYDGTITDANAAVHRAVVPGRYLLRLQADEGSKYQAYRFVVVRQAVAQTGP
ncbi:MAG: S8 family serine peptidase [Calditerricola sp.]|nr:S8 family serine peptidase [Calditerricola sp.]